MWRSPTWKSRRRNWLTPFTLRRRPANGSASSSRATSRIRCSCLRALRLPAEPGAASRGGAGGRTVVHVAVAHHRRCIRTMFADHCAARCPPYLRCPPLPVLLLPVVEQSDLDAVARQLGREPRGVLEIAYRCPNGEPGVVKTAPRLPDGTPFPTLYYLTHPALTAAASRLESSGLMREMTDRLGAGPAAGRCLPPRARGVSGRA